MTEAIDDVEALPGRKVLDQEQNPIGEVKHIYAQNGDGEVGWVTVEAKSGLGSKRTTFIPLARLKEENGELLVPYSKSHILDSPEVEAGEEISEEDERKLRDHFGIDTADQELRADNHSYATLVPEGEGRPQRVEDPSQLEAPNADRRTEETRKRLEDPGSAETRKITADDVTTEGADSSRGQADDESAGASEKKEKAGGEAQERPSKDAESQS